MKRVKAACICQTLHFLLKGDLEYDDASRLINTEVENYKASLCRNKTKHKIFSEESQPDGSVIIKINKQYNASPVGNYLE